MILCKYNANVLVKDRIECITAGTTEWFLTRCLQGEPDQYCYAARLVRAPLHHVVKDRIEGMSGCTTECFLTGCLQWKPGAGAERRCTVELFA